MDREEEAPPKFYALPKPRCPSFRGLYTEDIEAFIANVKSYFILERTPKKDRLPLLYTMVKENALVYCKNVAMDSTGICDIFYHLRKRYSGPWYENQRVRELYTDYQRPNESNSAFIERKMQLIKRLPSYQKKIDMLALIRGQFRPIHPFWSLNAHIMNVEHLLQAAKLLESNKTFYKKENLNCTILIDRRCPLNKIIHPKLCKGRQYSAKEFEDFYSSVISNEDLNNHTTKVKPDDTLAEASVSNEQCSVMIKRRRQSSKDKRSIQSEPLEKTLNSSQYSAKEFEDFCLSVVSNEESLKNLSTKVQLEDTLDEQCSVRDVELSHSGITSSKDVISKEICKQGALKKIPTCRACKLRHFRKDCPVWNKLQLSTPSTSKETR